LGHGWNVKFEIGPYPMIDNKCTTWRSIFTDNGIVQITKDYRFCRGRSADDLYIDEGVGTVAVQWINDVLVSPFKFAGVFAVASLRMRGDILEEEIVMTADNPAVKDTLVSVRAHSIHLKKMRRISV
jgi:hypothetical protein